MKGFQVCGKVFVKALPGMAMGKLSLSHTANISIKLRTYVVELMENDPELLLCRKIEETGHIKVDQIFLKDALALHLWYGIDLPAKLCMLLSPFKACGHHLSIDGSPAVLSVRGNAYCNSVSVNVTEGLGKVSHLTDNEGENICEVYAALLGKALVHGGLRFRKGNQLFCMLQGEVTHLFPCQHSGNFLYLVLAVQGLHIGGDAVTGLSLLNEVVAVG